MNKNAKGITILLWNGDYENSEFIVKKNKDGKCAKFNYKKDSDKTVEWLDKTEEEMKEEYKDWENFEEEQVNCLDDICF